MGNVTPTQRLQVLMDLGFSAAESRQALDACGGDVDKAAALLHAERRTREMQNGGQVAYYVNEILRRQRPWNEFFERFLWPEHLHERVRTNLGYYSANYCLVCAGVVLMALLTQPALLFSVLCVTTTFIAALGWPDNEPLPLLNQPLGLPERLSIAGLASALGVHYSGAERAVARVVLTCAILVLAHATFRARSLSSRWHRFTKDATEKVD